MQGKAALHDLARAPDIAKVVVADADPLLEAQLRAYQPDRVSGRIVDAHDEVAVAALMHAADVVVEALPGHFALPMGRLAAECGVSLVSSMYFVSPGEADPAQIAAARAAVRDVDRMAKQKGIVILTEFGLDPGLDLVLGARALSEVGAVREFRAYGAGIPAPGARDNPLKYRFSWSSLGVMRSYHRPARLIAGGEVVTVEATRIFEPQHVHRLDVPAIEAPLECYPNGDAVHYAELFGIRDQVREMGRYTGRLPGHCAFWDTMVKCGFLDERPVSVGDTLVSPANFVSTVLASQPQFRYGAHEADLTFVRVDVRGTRASTASRGAHEVAARAVDGVSGRGAGGGGGRSPKPRTGAEERVRVVYDLVDRRDFGTGFTSMQRTVGYTLSLGAQLILRGALPKRGVLTPLDVPYELVFPSLAHHNIQVTREEALWR
jgi:saccharopine dehydrogenase-like NADP-dependent oxidoreductase